MISFPLNLLIADDDPDDRMFFKEALEELPVQARITMVNDGVQLMELLHKSAEAIPDILFLDLNMPRKNGFECLSEIKGNEKLKHFPVIIYSTSLNDSVAYTLYEIGAHHYICKPGDFAKLKKAIHHALLLVTKLDGIKPLRENFVIKV